MLAVLQPVAHAQTDDPIASGSFELKERVECAPVRRQAGDVFSGPRGYLVEKREIEATGGGDRIWVEERFVLRNRGKSCPTARCAGARCGQVQVRLPLPPRSGFGTACTRQSARASCEGVGYRRDPAARQIVTLELPMLQPDASVDVVARYVVPAVPLQGARSWLSATLPPRGLDERAVDKVVLVSPGGQNQTRDTGLSVDLQVPSPHSDQPLINRSQRTVVIVDRSPSMDGPAQGRVARVVAAMLDVAPPDKDVRFGYLRGDLQLDPDYVPVQSLGSLRSLLHPANPTAQWLRATTAISALGKLFSQDVRRGDQVVVLGDAAFHLDGTARAFFAKARKRGVRIELLNLDPHAADRELRAMVERTGGRVRELGLRWELVPRHLLDDYVRGMLHGALRVPRHRRERVAWKREALRDLETQMRAARPEPEGMGVPAESALRMLREQLVPSARSCLRQDRRGRAAHSRRATFEFDLTRQEIEGLRVRGKLPESLRSCLYEAAAKLTVPRFEGRVRVRYPIYTEKLDVPPMVKLRPETRALLDDLLSKP